MAKKHMSLCKIYRGWHSSPTGKFGISSSYKSTEGVGYYLAFDKGTAESFGGKVRPAELILCNPLDARGELPYILHESDELFEPTKKTDSVWLSSIKEAVKRSGTTETNFGIEQIECLNQTLTDILQEKGYDGILIDDWGVEFARPRERVKLEGCKT